MASGAPARAAISGLVLAGGRGTRMGGADKGWVAYGGRPLIHHVLGRLEPQVGTVIINANRNLERYAALGHPVVRDGQEHGAFAGPLAGIAAGMRASALPWIGVVPCDAPQLPANLFERLAGAVTGQVGAVAHAAGRIQPVFCLLPVAWLPLLEAALALGEHRPGEFLQARGAVVVPFEDAGAFLNLNAPEPGLGGSA